MYKGGLPLARRAENMMGQGVPEPERVLWRALLVCREEAAVWHPASYDFMKFGKMQGFALNSSRKTGRIN